MHKLLVASAAVLVCLLCAPAAPTGAADCGVCHVRNVTRGSSGLSLKQMVRAAHDGDRLWVRGRCTGGVVIGKDLTIRGVGDAVVTGLERYRVFRIRAGATVTLRHLIIAHGLGKQISERGGGGGIYNEGVVTLADSIVRRCRAGEDPGGAIANYGTMTIRDTLVRHSRADWGGGIGNLGTLTVVGSRVLDNFPEGIWSRGPMSITDSVVRGNAWGGLFVSGTADVTISATRISDNRRGGGIDKAGGGTLTLEACLVTGNTSAAVGGGIAMLRGRLDLIGTTITGNQAATYGGGIFAQDGSTTVTLDGSSSVTGNTPDDCYGTLSC